MHRLRVGETGAQSQPLLLGMPRQAVGVQEILAGNLLQLECMRDHRLQLPAMETALPPDHKGLVMYRVA